MAWRDLKKLFDSVDLSKLPAEKLLLLRCLFEMSGNLDTLAVCARESEKRVARLEELIGPELERIFKEEKTGRG